MDFEYDGELSLTEPLDLYSTLESGQTFLWGREDHDIFAENFSKAPVYTTARRRQSGEVMVVRITQDDGMLLWESTHSDAGEYLTEVFRLDEDYNQIRRIISERDPQGVIDQATSAYPGLRVVNEPLFPTLISFICSATATLARIRGYVEELSERYGDSVVIDGQEYAAFPTVAQLASVSEAELRDLDFGIRAKRIAKTVEAIRTDSPPLTPLPTDRDDARAHLQEYYGVGPKVASCVLLYGGGHDSAVPVDTWIDQAVEKYYPEFTDLSREAAAQELEELYGEYAGHGQLYLFHYIRMNSDN